MSSHEEPKLLETKRAAARRMKEAAKHAAEEDEAQDLFIYGPPAKGPAEPTHNAPKVDCLCGETDASWPIVRCRYLHCSRKFFHAECVGLPSNQNAWSCEPCKEQHTIDPAPKTATSASRKDLPAPEEQQAWFTTADVDKLVPPFDGPRGPRGDIYGLGASQYDLGPPEYIVPPAALSNPLRRFLEQAELERDTPAARLWRAEVEDMREVEWEVDEVEEGDVVEEEEDTVEAEEIEGEDDSPL